MLRKKVYALVMVLIISVLICACQKENGTMEEFSVEETASEEGAASEDKEGKERLQKGYDLPVEEGDWKEAEADCKMMMGLILDIYRQADKGEASNIVLNDETLLAMQEKVSETGFPVMTTIIYGNMENHEKADHFLKQCMEGKNGTQTIYEIRSDGGIRRIKYRYDGTDMYELSANAVWGMDGTSEVSYVAYTRIKEWGYSDKGWFCYQLCVPEYPEVTETVDGSRLLRIKPMTEELREMSWKCVKGLAYQGNNLLCSNWDEEHMEELDYNGLYEYLYGMKYQERFEPEGDSDGIPKERFEELIMEYLPITAEQIQKYAVFNEENKTYAWERLGCLNHAPNFFGTSLPEVIDIKENDDGTLTLTVDAVCEMMVYNDAVITHELVVRFAEDGSFRYLGNKILDNGIENIPEYQYRINGQQGN